MKKFMDDNFLLETKTSQDLYFNYAKNMPIIDYHCHLSPKEIYEDKKFKDITEVWLADGHFGDHYKWRLMRAYGVSEEYITGNKPSKEKFMKWASTIEHAIGNPVYHWAHLELKAFFNFDEPLTSENAEKVYEMCNEKLKDMSSRKLIESSNVSVICTTDDPVDDLKYHRLIKQDKNFKVKVLPAFRPDKAVNIELGWYLDWVNTLGKVSNTYIDTFEGFIAAINKRIAFFDENGCKISDHALDTIEYREATFGEVKAIYEKRLQGETLTDEEVAKYKTYMIVFFGRKYHERGWVQQYHISAMRNNNTRCFKELGPDTGYDAIQDKPFAEGLTKLLNALDMTDQLPKTILYSLNPNYDQILTTIGYCFNKDIPGKIQIGSGWWFNDHIDGMYRQMKSLANCGLISQFVGMLTDSRSFMSYPRHDYFRRILCNLFGNLVEDGLYPKDMKLLGEMVQDICYNNAKNYFNFK